MKPIYMDHHATTPLDPAVLQQIMPYLTNHFGNPSSTTHEYGRQARRAVDRAREQVAAFIGAQNSDEIVFTSGATEADNLALKGIALHPSRGKGHLLTLATEHKAILDTVEKLKKQGFSVDFIRIDRDGWMDLDHLQELIRSDTLLISVQAANSEIGTLQPIAEIGKIARERGVPFHTDAVQALGRVPIDVVRDSVDLLSISAHKMYGPKGVGALYVRKGVRLASQIDGGGHERGMRSGTLNVAGIVGLGAACEMAAAEMPAESERLRILRDYLIERIENELDYTTLNGHRVERLPNNANFSFAFVEGESLLLACRDVALSSGSACTSASLQSSYVLKAIGIADSLAHCSIRFGLGKSNTREHVDFVVDLLKKHVVRLREMSPLYEMAKEGIDIDQFNWGEHSHDEH
ncbi:IscS subfamily cysteine desulfurase [candidate division KSB1 bacterium]|nr:IscS subfamily cysteine desulfurase [candidate division KSB1 bacterium]